MPLNVASQNDANRETDGETSEKANESRGNQTEDGKMNNPVKKVPSMVTIITRLYFLMPADAEPAAIAARIGEIRALLREHGIISEKMKDE
jgi:hypothetical protein